MRKSFFILHQSVPKGLQAAQLTVQGRVNGFFQHLCLIKEIKFLALHLSQLP